MKRLNILILDDEERIREELYEFFSSEGCVTHVAASPDEALATISTEKVDIAILDLNLPGKDGITVLKEIKEFDPDIEVLIITGQGDMEKAIKAMRFGAVDFFNKPLRLEDVVKSIERTKRFIELNKEYKKVLYNYEQILPDLNKRIGVDFIGKSKVFKELTQQIKTAADNPDVPVLISGESGTGKELVARSIHYLSKRKNKFFYTVNCAAVPDNLFESEFFGHTRGAFTNATNSKPGWFEIADGGSLFLDEIGDMNVNMQAKLLRITEDGQVRRVGSNTDIPIDARIITATNKNIVELVQNGRFRHDLFHRINTFHIEVAPLREREEDIPLLVEYFIKHFSVKSNKKICKVENKVMKRLSKYNFPGNVRELKNLIERAVMLCSGSKLTMSNFSFDNLIYQSGPDKLEPKEDIYNLETVEKNTITKALEKTGYNKLQAAKLLGITWQSLERRIIKYNLRL